MPTPSTFKLDKYTQHIDWLFQQFPAFQKQGGQAYKPGLSHTLKLLSLAELNIETLNFIHVAGTNGKGSVCSIVASILREKKYTVGLFTSPHLFDFRERIRVNGILISEQEVVHFCELIRNTELDFKPSFFEITFVLAIRHFISQQCDYVVLETGMGGRLDATNVVTPLISIITNIGLDHQQYLGNTLQEIAKEKAGIIKEKVPVLIGRKQDEVHSIFEEKATSMGAELLVSHNTAGQYNWPEYQLENLNTAINALNHLDVKCSQEVLDSAVHKLRINTGYQKRMELVQKDPAVMLDVSHNEEGLKSTICYIKKHYTGSIYVVFGSTKERQVDASFLALFRDTKLFFCTFSNERSKSVKDWEAINKQLPEPVSVHTDVTDLASQLRSKLNNEDVLLITGSFFLIADLNLVSIEEHPL